MENYIFINGQRIDLTDDQTAQIKASFQEPTTDMKSQSVMLSRVAVGDTVKVGNFEMVVLEQHGTETSLILKDLYVDESEFGTQNNRYYDSVVDSHCETFAQALSEAVGWDNIVFHEVDLTSDDGLKDYGTVERKASLLTADMYRKYVDILDTVNPKKYWWLATPYSTKRHENDYWILCVAPSGSINYVNYIYDYGVRPFCILKSSIFVSG